MPPSSVEAAPSNCVAASLRTSAASLHAVAASAEPTFRRSCGHCIRNADEISSSAATDGGRRPEAVAAGARGATRLSTCVNSTSDPRSVVETDPCGARDTGCRSAGGAGEPLPAFALGPWGAPAFASDCGDGSGTTLATGHVAVPSAVAVALDCTGGNNPPALAAVVVASVGPCMVPAADGLGVGNRC